MSITQQDMIAHRTARPIEENFVPTFLYDAPPDLAGLAIPLVAANAIYLSTMTRSRPNRNGSPAPLHKIVNSNPSN